MASREWQRITEKHKNGKRWLVSRIDPDDAQGGYYGIPMWPQICHWGLPTTSNRYDGLSPCWVVTWDKTPLVDQPTHCQALSELPTS